MNMLCQHWHFLDPFLKDLHIICAHIVLYHMQHIPISCNVAMRLTHTYDFKPCRYRIIRRSPALSLPVRKFYIYEREKYVGGRFRKNREINFISY